MKRKEIPVVYEDDAILVCKKPAGMPVQSDKSKDIDMIISLKLRLCEQREDGEEPYLAAVHRLDRPVGGLMVFAKTREAAAALSEQIEKHEFEKNYQAVVCGNLPDFSGTFEDYLLRDGRTNTSKIVDADVKGAKKAVLTYDVIDTVDTKEGPLTWVAIALHTGRHHQIRVQFAARGHGLYGDTKYNPRYQKVKRRYMELGLYSTRLAFAHPTTGERVVFKAEPEGEAFAKMDVAAF